MYAYISRVACGSEDVMHNKPNHFACRGGVSHSWPRQLRHCVQRYGCKHNVLSRSIWREDSTEWFAFLVRSHS